MTVKLMTSTSVSNNAPAAATVFAQQAQAAGVTVKVDNVTGDVFWGDEYLKWGFAMDNWGTRGYLAQTGMGTMPGALYDETHWAPTNQSDMDLVNEAMKTVDDAKRNELITRGRDHRVQRGRRTSSTPSTTRSTPWPRRSWACVPDYSGLGSCREQRAVPPRLVRVTDAVDRSAACERALRPLGRGARRAA